MSFNDQYDYYENVRHLNAHKKMEGEGPGCISVIFIFIFVSLIFFPIVFIVGDFWAYVYCEKFSCSRTEQLINWNVTPLQPKRN